MAESTTTTKKAEKSAVILNTARLRADYNQKIAGELQKELGLTNPHQVPKLQKITLNVGLGKRKNDKKTI